MKFTCAKAELNEALNTVSRAVAIKPSVPITAGIYFKADGNGLELQANNFSLGVIAKISANVAESGEIVILGKLPELVRLLSGETVTFSHQPGESVVTITSESAAFTLLVMNATEFPKVMRQESNKTFKLRTDLFKDLVRKTVFSCAPDTNDARAIFKGCYLEIIGDQITMAATNTHRLAIMRNTLSEDLGAMDYIIPAKMLRNLQFSRNVDSQVTVECAEKYIAFIYDNIFMQSRLIEGQFPPYEKVVPKESNIFATIKVAELAAAVERIAFISKTAEYNTIRFIFTQEGITVSSTSPDVGKAEEHVDAQVEGGDLDISFNVNYIKDVLKVIDSETCRFAMTKPLAPIDVREVGNDNFIYVVTPVRTSN